MTLVVDTDQLIEEIYREIDELKKRVSIVEKNGDIKKPVYINYEMRKLISGAINEHAKENNLNNKKLWIEIYEKFYEYSNVNVFVESNSLGQSKLKTIEYLGWLNPFRCFVEDYLGGVKIGEWSGDGDYPDNYK